MKEYINLSWDKGNKYFSIINYKKEWKKNLNKPMFGIKTNGTRKKSKNTCFDFFIYLGYIVINYTDYNYNK